MIYVEVCVGSSCHIKGAPEIVEKLQKKISDNKLEDDIILTGSFCTGKCNREGVTVTVDDVIYTGVTPENFNSFFEDRILKPLSSERM